MSGRNRSIQLPLQDGRYPRRTVWVICFAIATFLLWAANAPLEIVIRGNGTVVTSMKKQIVQNLEGGIVQNVLVAEGDQVEEGQIIARMDASQFKNALRELNEQRVALLVRIARLNAEKEVSGQLKIDAGIQMKSPEIAASEIALFKARIDDFTSNLETLESLARLRRDEVKILKPMVEKSAVPEIELVRAMQLAIEAEGKVESLRTEFEAKRSELFAETLVSLMQIEEQIRAKLDQLERTEVRSPVKGIVNRVSVTTVGGVVGSGDPLFEILPTDQPLRIEGRIAPGDIGFVFPGMRSSIKLTAFDYSIYGTLTGEVVHVGADTVIDETNRGALSYYEIHIEIDSTVLSGPTGVVEIRPGMLSIVELDAGRRTVLQYLLKPLFKSNEALGEL